MGDTEIELAILALVHQRAQGKTVCPSEVARGLAGEQGAWRDMMPGVRSAADRLVQAGCLRVTQRGAVVGAVDAVGPVRLGRPTA